MAETVKYMGTMLASKGGGPIEQYALTQLFGGGVVWDDANGRLGIGTTSPNSLLDLKGNNIAYAGQLRIQATDYAHITFYSSLAPTPSAANMLGQIYYDVSSKILSLQNHNGTTCGPIVLNAGGGYVGIGGTSPNEQLHLRAGIALGLMNDYHWCVKHFSGQAYLGLGYWNYAGGVWYPSGSETLPALRIHYTGIININNCPTYSSNATAKSAGLVAGDLYQQTGAPGWVCIVY
jgi:hypothetical protein